MACLNATSDKRFQGRLEFYKWLRNITPEQIDATIKEMQREYRFRNTKKAELRERTNGLLKTTMEAVKKNVVVDAEFSSSPS